MDQIARIPKQIGEIVRLERQRKGFSQTMLADKAGLTQPTVSLVENGHEPTKISTICEILMALDLEFVIRPRTKGSAQEIEDIF